MIVVAYGDCLADLPTDVSDQVPSGSAESPSMLHGRSLRTGDFGGRKGCESMAETLGVSRYCDQWRRAIAQHTAFTAVQTWNDFSEDHGITDSNYRGRTLIALTRYFTDWYHAGTPPTITREQVYLFHHRQLTGARLALRGQPPRRTQRLGQRGQPAVFGMQAGNGRDDIGAPLLQQTDVQVELLDLMTLADEFLTEPDQFLPDRVRGRAGLPHAQGTGLRHLEGGSNQLMLVVQDFKHIHTSLTLCRPAAAPLSLWIAKALF